MLRPLIAITSCIRSIGGSSAYDRFNGVRRTYVDAVAQAGGNPVILPVLRDADMALDILNRVQGIVFSGGEDVSPKRYGEDFHPKTDNSEERDERDEIEFALVEGVLERRLPALFICRGMQLLSVASGGKLFQHLQDDPNRMRHHHQGDESWEEKCHHLQLKSGSRLVRILGNEVRINSLHHQGVACIGSKIPLNVVSCAEDGLIEIVESAENDRFLVGIQGHPEALSKTDPQWHSLFVALVEASSQRITVP